VNSIEHKPPAGFRKRVPDTSLRQPTVYADAAIRGKLRHWKEKLARQYRAIDRVVGNSARLSPVVEDMVKRGSLRGRHRAFEKIAQELGAGVVLEGLRLEGDYPVAVWSALKPRESLTVEALVESGLAQNCVTVNYVLAGVEPPGDRFGIMDGLWTLELPDHALGRAIERSGLLPGALIAEAHHNLLRLRTATILQNDNSINSERRFLVKAGAGGFVCRIRAAPDISRGDAIQIHARSDTWLAEDMLRDEQILLADDDAPGERLGDRLLLPAPLLRIVRDADMRLHTAVWAFGLPELLANPAGRA